MLPPEGEGSLGDAVYARSERLTTRSVEFRKARDGERETMTKDVIRCLICQQVEQRARVWQLPREQHDHFLPARIPGFAVHQGRDGHLRARDLNVCLPLLRLHHSGYGGCSQKL